MKTKFSVKMLCLLSVLALSGVSIANGGPNISGIYEASKLKPTDLKKIEIYLQQELLGQYGEAVGISYDFTVMRAISVKFTVHILFQLVAVR